jgi:C4-dicarboxylate-specific signal transduction histidine kinase
MLSLAQTVGNVVGVCVAAFDTTRGQLMHANASFTATFCDRPDAPLKQADLDRQFEQDSTPNAARAGAAQPAADTDRLHRPSGRWFHVRRSTTRHGALPLVVFELTDITQRLTDEQRRRSEHQQLLFTSKVMSVGEMAATLAHELNQPIGSVLNFLNGCVRRLERGAVQREELHSALVEARQQCERAAAIITRIREFVRSREPKMAEVRIESLFNTVAGLLESEIRLNRIEVVIDVPPALPVVLADRVMIEQVTHNLTKNAIEAMRQQAGRRRLTLSARVDASGMLEASVRDTGHGVAEGAREQLFSPFFTTKADGLGIGLNICRSMMEFHGGSLYYTQPADGGSRFCFSLPHQPLDGDTP